MKMLTKLLDSMEAPLNALLDRPVLGGIIKVFLVAYVSLVAPKLPPKVLRLLDNPFVKMVFVGLIVYVGTKDLATALLLSVAFIMTMLSLVKLETVSTVAGLLNTPVDVAQDVMNQLLDGAQSATSDLVSMVPSPVGSVLSSATGMLNNVVDRGQGVINSVVDTAQDFLLGVGETNVNDNSRELQREEVVSAYDSSDN